MISPCINCFHRSLEARHVRLLSHYIYVDFKVSCMWFDSLFFQPSLSCLTRAVMYKFVIFINFTCLTSMTCSWLNNVGVIARRVESLRIRIIHALRCSEHTFGPRIIPMHACVYHIFPGVGSRQIVLKHPPEIDNVSHSLADWHHT